MKRSPLEKFLSATLVAAVLIVIANAWLAFHAEQVLADSEYWVAHTWEVISVLEHAVGQVKDAETGARGYLITGDTNYLAVHDAAEAALPADLAHLRALVSDNPAQVVRMDELARTAEHRVALIRYTIGVRQTQGQAAAFKVVSDNTGLAEMDHLRRLITEAQQEEHHLLVDRSRASVSARREARAAVAFASSLDILFIVVTVWSLGYERRLRNEARAAARRLEKLQAISDVGLTQLSLTAMTDAMLERLCREAAIDAVALCGWRGTEIEVIAAKGVSMAAGTRVPVQPDGPCARTCVRNEVVRLQGAEVNQLAMPPFREEMLSVMLLPLRVPSRVIGMIVVGRRHADAFRPEDDELLLVVADRIALAIERASLDEGEREARRLAEAAAAEVQLLNAELEERVRLRTAELEATNRELEAFSYSVSHDLRAPLRSVDGFSVALEEDYGAVLSGEGKHYLARIRAGVQRMGQLIDALLQLSRITRADIVIEPVDLSALASQVADELSQEHPGRNIRFQIEPGLTAQGDVNLLRAVLENMFGNAVKFTARLARGAYRLRLLAGAWRLLRPR